jgi:TPP-dependent pyruvate/acetoin dehydrogenase alpha subunit
MRYVPSALVEEWRERDPLDRQERRLAELGVDVAALREQVRTEIERGAEEALAQPMPDPAGALDGVFCTGEPVALGEGLAPWSGFQETADA